MTKKHEQALWDQVRGQADYAQVSGVVARDLRMLLEDIEMWRGVALNLLAALRRGG